MLEGMARTPFNGAIHRLAGRRSVQRTAEKLGLAGDDLRDFEEAIGPESLAKILLSDPFDEKVIPDMPPFGFPSRFSDGNYPVFYASAARETSEGEMRYHREQDAVEDVEKRFPLHMWAFHCVLTGRIVDVRPMHAAWQWLTSVETCNPDCLKLGKEAYATRDIDALLAPSARHAGGTTVPTFSEGVLSNPEIDGTTVFTFDVVAGSVSSRRDGESNSLHHQPVQ